MHNTVTPILDKMPCYRREDRAMRPIYRLFHPNFVHTRPLLCADLILNEFEQIAFSALIEWSDVDFERSQ